MRKILLLAVLFCAYFQSFSQCPNPNFVIVLNSQAAINNFAAQYASCPDLSTYTMDIGQINQPATDIVDLTPLSFITGLNALWIENNPLLTSLDGIQDINLINYLELESNAQLSSLEFVPDQVGPEFSLTLIDNPQISDLASLPEYTELFALAINNMSGLSDLSGLENLNNIRFLNIIENQNLTSTSIPGFFSEKAY